MHYVIDRVNVEKISGWLRFWAKMWNDKASMDNGDPPFFEDFTIAMDGWKRQAVTDVRGFWELEDGSKFNPKKLGPEGKLPSPIKFTIVERDMVAEMERAMVHYFANVSIKGGPMRSAAPFVEGDTLDSRNVKTQAVRDKREGDA